MPHARRRAKFPWLFGITFLLAASTGIVLLKLRDSPVTGGTKQYVRVALLNGWDVDYIWVDRTVSVRAWPSGSDASDDPIAITSGLLELPENHLGTGFFIPANKIAHGHISLPSNFDLRDYIEHGHDLKVAVKVVPRGFYNPEFPFRADPDIWLGNAYGRLYLDRHGQPDTIYLEFQP